MDKEILAIAKNLEFAEERGIDLYISADSAVIKISRKGLDVIISIKYDHSVCFMEIMRYSAVFFRYIDTANNIKTIQKRLCRV